MSILSSLIPISPSIKPFLKNPHHGVFIAAKNPVRRFFIRCEAMRDDGFYMRRCVELARSALGHTSPNPMVGCVIVRDGEIVGEGFHPKAGQPHAEVIFSPFFLLYPLFFIFCVFSCSVINL